MEKSGSMGCFYCCGLSRRQFWCEGRGLALVGPSELPVFGLDVGEE